MKSFINTSRLLSVFVAAIDIWAVYSCYSYEEKILGDGPRLYGPHGYVIAIFGTLVLLAMILSLIWFAEELSDFEKSKKSWCPPFLIKFAGWVFLLTPSVIFIWITIT